MRSRDVAQAPNFSLGLLGFIVTQCVTSAPRNPQEGSQLNHPLSGTGDMGTSRPTEANLMLAPHIPPRAVDTCHVPLSPSPWLSNNIYSSSRNLAGATALFREAVTPLSPPPSCTLFLSGPPTHKLSVCPLSASRSRCHQHSLDLSPTPLISHPTLQLQSTGVDRTCPAATTPLGTCCPPSHPETQTALDWGERRKIWIRDH